MVVTQFHGLSRGMVRAMDERRDHPGGLSPANFFEVLKYGHHAGYPGSAVFNDGDIESGDVVRVMRAMAGGAGNVTAIQSNPTPVGGVVATQPVPPAGEMTPTDLAALVEELTPAATRFRKQSTLLKVKLETKNYTTQGDDQTARFSNVGLGYLVITHHHFAISVANTNAAPQTVTLSPWFPLSLVNNSIISINGGSSTFAANALGSLVVAARAKRNLLQLNTRAGRGEALDPVLCTISTDANGTLTSAANGTFPAKLSGITTWQIAGLSTSVLTVDFVTFEKIVADFESGVGALPLQNNSTYATLERILQSAFLSTNNDDTFSFNNAGANLSVSAVTGFSEGIYEFASIPADQTLYNDMVVNSYQVQQQRNVTANGTGTQAWTYNIPQNLFLMTAHMVWRDGNNKAIDQRPVLAKVPQIAVVYNGGSIQPVLELPWMDAAEHYMAHGDSRIPAIGGYRIWDGEDTSNTLNSTDEMNWIDTYNAAQPQITANLDASITGNALVDVTREAIVSGSVQVVGG